MSDNSIESYEDWYDNGPGSEKFKRELHENNVKTPFLLKVLNNKKMSKKVKNSNRALSEQIKALARQLDANSKLFPHISINKGLLEEIVKNGKRVSKYVEELEND
jgi:hypothetical protein